MRGSKDLSKKISQDLGLNKEEKILFRQICINYLQELNLSYRDPDNINEIETIYAEWDTLLGKSTPKVLDAIELYFQGMIDYLLSKIKNGEMK